MILLPASAAAHVRLFKDVPNLYFSFRINATEIWKYCLRLQIVTLNFDAIDFNRFPKAKYIGTAEIKAESKFTNFNVNLLQLGYNGNILILNFRTRD